MRKAISVLSIFFIVLFLVSMARPAFFSNYTGLDGVHVGAPLDNIQEMSVNNAIELLRCLQGESDLVSDMDDIMDAGEMEAETNPEVNKGTGNSSNFEPTSSSGGNPVSHEQINLGEETLDLQPFDDPVGIALLAGVLAHEAGHIYNAHPDNNECVADIAQVKTLCQIACGAPGCMPDPATKEALCAKITSKRRQAFMSSNRHEDQSVEWIQDNLPHCDCCDGVPTAPSPPISADMILAGSFVPVGYKTGCDTFTPLGNSTYRPEYTFFAEPSPELSIIFSQPSDGFRRFLILPITLNIFPTAITGDENGNIFLAGITTSGLVQVVKYAITFSGDNVTASAPTTVFSSNKMDSISSMTYTEVNSEGRIYALDGHGGKFGYYNLITGQIKTMAALANDSHMVGWKSFEMSVNEANGSMSAELCMKHANVNFTHGDDELYILVDSDGDGILDSRTLAYGHDVNS